VTFFSLVTLFYGSLHVLRYFVHWNCCIEATCSQAMCCDSTVLGNSVSADRIGVAA